MNILLTETMKFGGLKDVEVLAGFDGLDSSVVNNVTTIEVTSEEIKHYVNEGFLCLTTMYAIRDDVAKQIELVEILHSKKCTALVVCHVGIWIKELDSRVIARCNELNFPLLKPDAGVTYLDIMSPLMKVLMSDQIGTASFTALSEELIDLMVGEERIEQILKKSVMKFRRKITFLDSYGNCLFSDKPLIQVDMEKEYIKNHFNGIVSQLMRSGFLKRKINEIECVIYLLQSRNDLMGFMLIEINDTEYLEDVIQIAKVLNTLYALAVGKKEKSLKVKTYYLQEYLTDLLVWNFRTTEEAVERGADVGINLVDKNLFIIFNINELGEQSESLDTKITHMVNTVILMRIQNIATAIDEKAVVVFRSDQILVILNVKNEDIDVKTTFQPAVDSFKSNGISTVVGYSDYFKKPNEIPMAYNQAFNAVLHGRNSATTNFIVSYKEIYYLKALDKLKEDAYAIKTGYDILEPIIEYDEKHGTALMETLRLLILQNSDIASLSESMYIHRNTLLYRKNKIIEVLGYSPFEMPWFLNIAIALSIMK